MSEKLALFQPALDALTKAASVMLTAHVSPDGDAIGGMLALHEAIRARYANITRVDCVICGGVPGVYDFLPGVNEIRVCEEEAALLPHYDVSISIDCGSLERLGGIQERFLSANHAINIDHHLNNARFGSINIVLPEAAASGEVVADLVDAMGVAYTPTIAACIYAALLTDTGGFRFSNVSADTHRLAARCIETGVDHEFLYKRLYEHKPRAQAMLHAEAISQAQFDCDQRLAWTTVSQTTFERYHARDEHTDGIVDALRQIDTVLAAVVFKEARDGVTRVSLRSDHPDLNVMTVAERFGGGGHKMAAGCTITGSLSAAQQEVLPLLRKALDVLAAS